MIRFNNQFAPKDQQEEDKHIGTWDSSGYSKSDSEAHRDRIYNVPSALKQTLAVFSVQMKLFAKDRSLIAWIIMVLLIPVIFYFTFSRYQGLITVMGSSLGTSNGCMAYCLFALPLMIALVTSTICGPLIPREFKYRTAYMNYSLPISRSTFYFGKYLAAFVFCTMVIAFAYGVSMLTVTVFAGNAGGLYTGPIMQSFGLSIVAVFAFSATAYCIGCNMKKGSTIVPFLVTGVALPAVLSFLVIAIKNTPDYASFEAVADALSLLPCFLGDVAYTLFGTQYPFSGGMILGLGKYYPDSTMLLLMAAIGVLWGIIFLMLGLYKSERREM